MKPTGIVRKVDELGRIVIPKELRITLGMDVGEPVEILTEGNNVILRRYAPEDICIVTGEVSKENMKLVGGNIVLSKKGARILMQEMMEQEGEVDNAE